MTGPRADAYGRVMHTLEEIGATKLLAPERERIREVADALLFAEDADGEAVLLGLLDAVALIDHLEHSGRWTAERAARLHADLRACGPAAGAEDLSRAA
ncbi:MAG: hypothetical protein QOD81_3323 [Solirubrobacteraceae bacterium]|nr:hypothetical protein [Solirubrobacteraceae bacterium]